MSEEYLEKTHLTHKKPKRLTEKAVPIKIATTVWYFQLGPLNRYYCEYHDVLYEQFLFDILERLNKYGVLSHSFVVDLLWLGILPCADKPEEFTKEDVLEMLMELDEDEIKHINGQLFKFLHQFLEPQNYEAIETDDVSKKKTVQ